MYYRRVYRYSTSHLVICFLLAYKPEIPVLFPIKSNFISNKDAGTEEA